MPTLYVSLGVSRADGLCPSCLLPSLLRLRRSTLRDSGVDYHEYIRCRDCRERFDEGQAI